jgi:hypothetical protein
MLPFSLPSDATPPIELDEGVMMVGVSRPMAAVLAELVAIVGAEGWSAGERTDAGGMVFVPLSKGGVVWTLTVMGVDDTTQLTFAPAPD